MATLLWPGSRLVEAAELFLFQKSVEGAGAVPPTLLSSLIQFQNPKKGNGDLHLLPASFTNPQAGKGIDLSFILLYDALLPLGSKHSGLPAPVEGQRI